MKDLTQFDPTIEKLTALVAESSGIVDVDIDDPTQIEKVKKARINLRNARVSIEKTGKAYREDALAYQRAVLSKEKELIGIIEPEEQRLKLFEKKAELAKERRLRVQQLPERRARLEKEGFPDNESILLEMDSIAFEEHFNGLVAEKNRKAKEEQDRIAAERQAELDKKEAELKAKEKAIEDERLAKEREEKARQEERERIEREAKEKKEREEREEKERKEKEEADRKALEKKKAYQKFLADNGWTPETAQDFKIENTPEGVVLWKRVSLFKNN